jgi:hypothetical protein
MLDNHKLITYELLARRFVAPDRGPDRPEELSEAISHQLTALISELIDLDRSYLLSIFQLHAKSNDLANLAFLIEYVRGQGFFYHNYVDVYGDILALILSVAITMTENARVLDDASLLFYVVQTYDTIFHQVRLSEYPGKCAALYFELTIRLLDTRFLKIHDNENVDSNYSSCLYFIGMADNWFSKRKDEFLQLWKKIETKKDVEELYVYFKKDWQDIYVQLSS